MKKVFGYALLTLSAAMFLVPIGCSIAVRSIEPLVAYALFPFVLHYSFAP